MKIDHIENRRKVLSTLIAELMGPAPMGILIDLNKGPFEDIPCVYKWSDDAPAEEILRRERPHLRYGVGVLYPPDTTAAEVDSDADEESPLDEYLESEPDGQEIRELKALSELKAEPDPSTDEDEQDLRIETANRFQPGSFGISFLIDCDATESIDIAFSGGRYDARDIETLVQNKSNGNGDVEDIHLRPATWFFRRPVTKRCSFLGSQLLSTIRGYIGGHYTNELNLDDLSLNIRCFVRTLPASPPSQRLVTVVAVNESTGNRLGKCIYQSTFTVQHQRKGDVASGFLPYPTSESIDEEEENQISLLYRDYKTFAVGHGCAADWGTADGNVVGQVHAKPLPCYEAPSTTHEISYVDLSGQTMQVPEIEMNLLADPKRKPEALAKLTELADHYDAWEQSTRAKSEMVPARLKSTADQNLDQCRLTAQGLRDGIAFLADDRAFEAFCIANHAMLLQRTRSKLALRRRSGRSFGPHPSVPSLHEFPSTNWRPFQIAFILLAIRSAVMPDDDNRDMVELIWFPTGGGKTEAYLGLAAFVCAYRRLSDDNDVGTAVIMRYTLRLLTQQQLLRAASLLCALDFLRTKEYRGCLGDARFTIGLWVGGSVTPSERSEALQILHDMHKGKRSDTNLIVLTRCPWCGAEMKADFPSANKGVVDGAIEIEQTVRYTCPDIHCHFNSDNEDDLPVEFIDEDLYRNPPTLVIGTVDKFATMHGDKARNARSLFGYSTPIGDEPAKRENPPPSLIIQDELHLISGPLGSTAGLYECLIEELCIDERSGKRIRPKIVCSTATVRGYREQISALYARKSTRLFPPSGIDASDSFFAQYARDESGALKPGRLYVGIHPTGFTSGQTSRVRTFSALLQAPIDLVGQYPACNVEPRCPYTDGPSECDENETGHSCRQAQDPWWTLMIFFNSLRDLGNAISLFQTDLPDYRRVVRRRRAEDMSRLRHAYQPMELTSRLRNTEIPTRLAELEVGRASDKASAVDVCLASSIIEVGIDVDRLSLLCVVAQPKTTATYIQVTGRVGRNWKEKPGLIATIYAADRPRDRSHFEHFRSYHERLYAQVEPTSVTPYSRPLLERAFHGVVAAYIRLVGTEHQANSPVPFPNDQYTLFVNKLLGRARRSGLSDEESAIRDVALLRMNKWRQKGPSSWIGDETGCLMQPATGNPLQRISDNPPYATSYSMRNVDAACELKASEDYINPAAYEAAFEVDDE